MRISWQWLQEFIVEPLPSAEEVAVALKQKTVEVEGVERSGVHLSHIVIGLVRRQDKHPQADRLAVCAVDIGGEEVSIVCGGTNVREGLKVAVAKIGAKVRWHGAGELVELKPATIRGIESQGMICAANEIGLADIFPQKEEKEILDLSFLEAPVGTPLASALHLNDAILDIDNKSLAHRPDLWGHYGMSREVAAIFGLTLKPYAPPAIKSGRSFDLRVDVRAADWCPRYTGVVVDGLTIAASPFWLQQRLRSVGVRPINTVVDITNYVMMEIGQPTHAFDVAHVGGREKQRERERAIVVRRAESGETITTLDGQVRNLTNEMLVIADEEKSLAIAGVMGGGSSEIREKTKTVIFESANFDAAMVRRMSQTLGLRTEGSARWEKSQDPHNADWGLRRLVELTKQLCPGVRVVSRVVDVKNFALATEPIIFPLSLPAKKLGVTVPEADIIGILTRLGFRVKKKGRDTLAVFVPSWRATKDIQAPEDVLEEILRLRGYEFVRPALPTFPITPPPHNQLRQLERRLKNVCAATLGFTEVYNYSFESPAWLERLGLSADLHLRLDNPVAKDRPLLRRHLFPNLLANLENNAPRRDSLRLFEIGHVYRREEAGESVDNSSAERLPGQPLMFGAMYAAKGVATPFFELAEGAKIIGEKLSFPLRLVAGSPSNLDFTHPGRLAQIFYGDALVGEIWELHPLSQARLGIPYRAAVVEINLSALIGRSPQPTGYRPLSLYPAVTRDIAFIVDRSVSHEALVAALRRVHPLIVSVELFDIYEGQNVPAGKKSLAYHVVYQSIERTLTSAEVDAAHAKVNETLRRDFRAKIRA
ncbi:MAG: phenylalanine--tRNA ligase subunit beta [Candidatus Magasanikbacteria bacterium]|nr:phenylalanine--tRNA ligase subunit beta [Candidatus Magasanikbacteria bacterium]